MYRSLNGSAAEQRREAARAGSTLTEATDCRNSRRFIGGNRSWLTGTIRQNGVCVGLILSLFGSRMAWPKRNLSIELHVILAVP